MVFNAVVVPKQDIRKYREEFSNKCCVLISIISVILIKANLKKMYKNNTVNNIIF